ncbi:response regulator, partial [Methylobacterium sp.]|uniref:hybrid sensor histidine kinase/response regulator n=1 Tax=Methylobacterium sp. TaxID=409 RepID=UPI00258077DB
DSAAAVSPAPAPAQAEEPSRAAPESASLLRVPADAVEGLRRATHDLFTALSGEAAVAEGIAGIGRTAADLRRRADGLRGQGALASLARGLDDETDRAAVESVRADLRALSAALDGLAREAADLARRQARLSGAVEGATSRVREGAERLALVPAETVFGGFARSLRETAREQGREVAVTERGLDLPVDRALLQALKDPVLHALRNALSHGAEPPEARRAAGKPEALAILFELSLRGGRLSVAVHDDGRGPDLAGIEETARRRGLLAADEAADPETLLGLVFEPGFSTARAVDALSGRGFGLSVVADAVRALRGGVRLQAREPHGTSLVMSLPLSAARRPVLLAEDGGALYALPGDAVARLVRVAPDDLGRALGRPVLRLPAPAGVPETALPVFALSELVGTGAAAEDGPVRTVVVLRAGATLCAVSVARLEDVRSLLILPPPPIGAERAPVSGTVVLPGDRPVLVLDPEALAARAAETAGAAPASGAEEGAGRAGTMPGAPRSTILVVDDSITTRTLEKGILEAAGYRVVVCVDGQDALDRLRAEIEPVNLVLADVEMPRLDGFGLLAALRADQRFARMPVILMTSRGDAEDVARGLELGADAYLTKQKFDQRGLLDTIGQLL